MTLFDSFKQRVEETARAAAKKSVDIVEITKMNINMGVEEDRIKRVYFDIGKLVYESFTKNEIIQHGLKVNCEKIQIMENNILEMRKKVHELRAVKECTACKTELDEDMGFCYKCGAKQEIPQKQEVDVQTETEIKQDEPEKPESKDEE